MDSLSDKSFWKDYWTSVRIPNRVDPGFSFDRCLDRFFSKNLTKSMAGATLIEIGCAPGRWLAYFSEKFGLKASGIDYSEFGVKKTRENLMLLGVDAEVLQEDFFKFNSAKKYDVVLSLGFIEHFEDQDRVIQKHLDLLKVGGLLVLGVPNFRGIYGAIQRHYCKDVLDKHNLGIMSLPFFHGIAREKSLEVLVCEYVGGFEPALFVKPPRPSLAQNLFIRAPLFALSKIRKLRAFDGLNHPAISGYMICILKKKR